jgi:hypothetical protein
MENRLQIIKDLETLLNATRAASGINIRYGWVERKYTEADENGERYLFDIVFHESDRELNKPDDPREEVQLRWGNQSDLFATYQSIECDSGIAIISDIMKAVNKMM